MFNSEELRTERRGKLDKLMEQLGLEALVLTRLENVRYATDMRPLHSIFFVEEYLAVVLRRERPFLLASEADEQFVRDKVPWVQWRGLPSFTPSGTIVDLQGRLIGDLLKGRAGAVGYDSMSVGLLESLVSASAARFVNVGLDILKMRAIKTALEADVIERTAQFAEIGMDAVRRALRPGVAEFQLAAEGIYAMKKAGAEAESHMPAIRSGENAARQQRAESDRRIVPGDAVIVDLGARYLGYSAEYCRTMMLGRPTAPLRALYKVLFDAFSKGLEMIKPGVRTGDLDRAVRNVISQGGYPDYPHATGHGIGVANGEYPTITRDSQPVLEEGMVVCIEPGIYVPGVGGVKEEDVVLVTHSGPKLLTRTAYDPVLGGN